MRRGEAPRGERRETEGTGDPDRRLGRDHAELFDNEHGERHRRQVPKGDRPERRTETFPPLAEAHISQPFLGLWDKPELIVGISSPIHDPSDEKKTIGVLLAIT